MFLRAQEAGLCDVAWSSYHSTLAARLRWRGDRVSESRCDAWLSILTRPSAVWVLRGNHRMAAASVAADHIQQRRAAHFCSLS